MHNPLGESFTLAGKVMSCAGTWLVHLESNTLSWFGSLITPTEVVFSDWILNYIGSSVPKLVSTVSRDILTVRWSACAEYPEAPERLPFSENSTKV